MASITTDKQPSVNPAEPIPPASIAAGAPGIGDAPPIQSAISVAPGDTPAGLFTRGQEIEVQPGDLLRPPIIPQQLDFHSEYSISANFRHAAYNRLYDGQLRMGSHLWVSNESPTIDPEARVVASFPQLNEILRTQYQKYLALVNATGNEVPRVDPNLVRLAKRIHAEGELSYHHIPNLKDNIRKQTTYEALGYCFPSYILDRWRYAGVIEKCEIQYPNPSSRSMTLCIGGITKTKPENYWGKVFKGQHLFFILKRHYDKVLGRHTYFEICSKVADEYFITPNRLSYLDSAGYEQYGNFIYVGMVRDDPNYYPSKAVCKILQGIGSTSSEAFAYRRYEQISIDVALMLTKSNHRSYACRF